MDSPLTKTICSPLLTSLLIFAMIQRRCIDRLLSSSPSTRWFSASSTQRSSVSSVTSELQIPDASHRQTALPSSDPSAGQATAPREEAAGSSSASQGASASSHSSAHGQNAAQHGLHGLKVQLREEPHGRPLKRPERALIENIVGCLTKARIRVQKMF